MGLCSSPALTVRTRRSIGSAQSPAFGIDAVVRQSDGLPLRRTCAVSQTAHHAISTDGAEPGHDHPCSPTSLVVCCVGVIVRWSRKQRNQPCDRVSLEVGKHMRVGVHRGCYLHVTEYFPDHARMNSLCAQQCCATLMEMMETHHCRNGVDMGTAGPSGSGSSTGISLIFPRLTETAEKVSTTGRQQWPR